MDKASINDKSNKKRGRVMKYVFLTGTNGLLGTNLVNLLLERGYCVKGLLRDISKYSGSPHKNLELFEGNLTDDHSEIIKKCDYVIHAAAETSQSLLYYEDYQKINVEATKCLFDVARRSKVKKFIFVSSANTLGYGSFSDPGTELTNIKAPFDLSMYARSKSEAEDFLLEEKGKTDVIIVNPSFMIGPHDTKPSSGKLILMYWNKKIVLYPPGGKNFVYVKDVAQGIINSLETGVSGEKYLLVNENLSYGDFLRKLKFHTGRRQIFIKVPGALLKLAGYFGDLLRFAKIKTGVSSVNMKILCTKNFYSNDKSIRELKLNYHPIEIAIEQFCSGICRNSSGHDLSF
jgi:nucleoside-diphosphate-sugar epimerase